MQPPESLRPMFDAIADLQATRERMMAHSRRLERWRRITMALAAVNVICAIANGAWVIRHLLHR